MKGSTPKSQRGLTSYHAGVSAEEIVARRYEEQGFHIVHRRWRGGGGEIDLIARNGDGFICIEVKKSRSFQGAAQALSLAQQRRILQAAESFMARQPMGSLTEIRFDVALVDQKGAVQLITNAFGET